MPEEKEQKNNEEIEVVEDAEGVAPEAKLKLEKLKNELKTCEKEKKEYLDGWQRAKADYINYKKEENSRFEALAGFAAMGLVQEILPVLDSFDFALSHEIPKDVERGVLLIRSQLEDALRKLGLETMGVKVGDEFNPEKHESLGESGSDVPAGRVAEIAQRGYFFKSKVLRPARVKISKGQVK